MPSVKIGVLAGLLAVLVLTLAGGAARASAADQGLLQRFAPRSATTWWAIVESNLHAKTWVVRTTDAGGRWRDVTPPVKLVSSSSFLGRKAAWIEAGARQPPRSEPVYRTLDEGRSWQRLAPVPSECELDFVDLRHGWCIAIGAAAGSAGVDLYRTSDGGSRWRLVSRTGVGGEGSTPGALPFGCDKTIGFTSPRVGWAAQSCNAGLPRLWASTDGGGRWRKLGPFRLPKRLGLGGGTVLSLPTVEGARLAVSLEVGPATGSGKGATVIATSTNRGRSWRSRLVPGPGYWDVDLVDVRHWRLDNGSTLLLTDDAGRSWQSRRAAVGTLEMPDFVSPEVGFLIPGTSGYPLWWTRDDGRSWTPITITAGPFTVRG